MGSVTKPRISGIHVLSNGRVVNVDPQTGVATFETCFWLVRVASGNPEPDSIEDTYRDVECGSRVFSLDGSLDHTACDAGHVRHAYGSAEQQAQELQVWFEECQSR